MHLLFLIALCSGFWLLFPKGFKFMVASWVGTAFGALAWGVLTLVLCLTDREPTWHFMGWSALGCVIGGIVVGCILAARE